MTWIVAIIIIWIIISLVVSFVFYFGKSIFSFIESIIIEFISSNKNICRLLGCVITIAVGSGALFWIYKWDILLRVIQGCMISIVLLLAVIPVEHIFGGKYTFYQYSMRMISSISIVAVGSILLIEPFRVLFSETNRDFLGVTFRLCLIAIIMLAVAMEIRLLFEREFGFYHRAWLLIGCFATVALGSGILYLLYFWSIIAVIIDKVIHNILSPPGI